MTLTATDSQSCLTDEIPRAFRNVSTSSVFEETTSSFVSASKNCFHMITNNSPKAKRTLIHITIVMFRFLPAITGLVFFAVNLKNNIPSPPRYLSANLSNSSAF